MDSPFNSFSYKLICCMAKNDFNNEINLVNSDEIVIKNNLPNNFQLLEYPIEHERSSRKA